MVNVIDNEARNRNNMMPVGIKIIDDKGDVAHTAKTDLGTNYISLESKWFDSSSNNTGGSTGENTGGNTGGNSDTTPAGTDTSGGINIIPGLLTDGSLTERYLEWQGPSQTGSPTTIEFLKDVGLNLNLVGDGLQFYGHIEKVPVTAGVQGTPTSVPLKFDPKNVSSAGYFVTTSPCPISINRSNFIVGKKITITLNGVGEALSNIKDHLAPTVSFTFNADKSMTVEVDQGHAFDAGTADNTGTVKTNGAFYTYVLDSVNSYSVQAPVSQLPPTIYVFQGASFSDMQLNGVSNYYDNITNGLEFSFDGYMYFNDDKENTTVDPNSHFCRISLADLGGPNSFKVRKEDLIIGNSVPITFDKENLNFNSDYMPDKFVNNWILGEDSHATVQSLLKNRSIKIESNSFKIGPIALIHYTFSLADESNDCYGFLKIASIKPY